MLNRKYLKQVKIFLIPLNIFIQLFVIEKLRALYELGQNKHFQLMNGSKTNNYYISFASRKL